MVARMAKINWVTKLFFALAIFCSTYSAVSADIIWIPGPIPTPFFTCEQNAARWCVDEGAGCGFWGIGGNCETVFLLVDDGQEGIGLRAAGCYCK